MIEILIGFVCFVLGAIGGARVWTNSEKSRCLRILDRKAEQAYAALAHSSAARSDAVMEYAHDLRAAISSGEEA